MTHVGTDAMSENNGDNGESIDYSQLYVYAGPDQPDPSNMTFYASDKFEVCHVPVQANIIGSSHYISAPSLPYRELTSCRPVTMTAGHKGNIRRYTIDGSGFVPEPSDSFTRHVGPYEATIGIEAYGHNPTATFDDWDLAYTFEGDGPSAPTALRFFHNGWDTVHVYPEFNVDLYTRTRFERRD